MIYNTKNWNNDATESQREKKTCFNVHAGGKLTVQCIVNKQIWKVYILGIGCGIKNLSYFKVWECN